MCPVSSEELEELLVENEAVVLRSIAEELRSGLPVEAMLVSERLALQKVGGARAVIGPPTKTRRRTETGSRLSRRVCAVVALRRR